MYDLTLDTRPSTRLLFTEYLIDLEIFIHENKAKVKNDSNIFLPPYITIFLEK
jgi:hypothetical protein